MFLVLVAIPLVVPALATATQVCVSTENNPTPVCAEMPVPGHQLIWIADGSAIIVVLGLATETDCSGEGDCGPDCGVGEGSAWWLRASHTGGPFGAWWEIEVDLPAPLCNCFAYEGCDAPECQVLSSCGESGWRARFAGGNRRFRLHHLGPPQTIQNPTTLPLHVDSCAFQCFIDDPCDPGPPTVNVPPQSQTVCVYVLARNYDSLSGVQTAFDFGPWVFVYGLWDCQPNQITGHVPINPGGSTAGTLSTAFDYLAGGATAVIGTMHFMPTKGCVTQVESALPFGTCVATGNHPSVPMPLQPEALGAVCVGTGGIDTCDPLTIAIRQTTWGGIKGFYGDVPD